MFSATAMLYRMSTNKEKDRILILLQILSSADANFISNVQSMADFCLKESNIQNWDDTEVVIFYLGMSPLPSRKFFSLPNGFPVRLFNLNLPLLPEEMEFLRPYATIENTIRKLLLQGLSPEDVLQTLEKDQKLISFLVDRGGGSDILLQDIIRFHSVLKQEGWI